MTKLTAPPAVPLLLTITALAFAAQAVLQTLHLTPFLAATSAQQYKCSKPDMTVSKTGPSAVEPGGIITYTATLTDLVSNSLHESPPWTGHHIPRGPTFLGSSNDDVECSFANPNPAFFGDDQNLLLCRWMSGFVVPLRTEVSCPPVTPLRSSTTQLQFRVPPDAACGSVYRTYAQASAAVIDNTNNGLPFDLNFSNNTSETVATTVVCRPDISVTLSAPASVVRGTTPVTTLNVANKGRLAAQNVVATSPLPAGFLFNAGGSDRRCSLQGGGVVCDIGTLNEEQAQALLLSYTVATVAPCAPTTIEHRASAKTSSEETNLGNNQSNVVTVRLDCPPPDLAIEKSGPTSIVRGSPLTTTITVTNRSSTEARTVVVRDEYQDLLGVQFDPEASDPRCVRQGNWNVVCTVGTLAPQQSKTVTLVYATFLVPNMACTDERRWSQASVSGSLPDGNGANNLSQELTTLIQCPGSDLSVRLAGPTGANPGNTLSYVVTVSNGGSQAAENVLIENGSRERLQFSPSGSDPRCSVQDTRVLCALGTIATGQSVSATIAFTLAMDACRAPYPPRIENQVRVRTSTPEASTDNNASTIVTTTLDCAQAERGCVTIRAEALSPDGSTLVPVPPFRVLLDGSTGTETDRNGNATFPNVSPGTHTVTQTLPQGWSAASVTPAGGQVSVQGSTQCAVVHVRNQQIPPDLTIAISGPSTITRGSTLSYNASVSNSGIAAAKSVTIVTPVPTGTTFSAGASDPRCRFASGDNTVECPLGTLDGGKTATVPVAFTVPITNPCRVSTLQLQAEVRSATPERSTSNNRSTVVTTELTCPVQPVGCIQIRVKANKLNGFPILTNDLPPFTFRLDDHAVTKSDAIGTALFNDVSVGEHTVREVATPGWSLVSLVSDWRVAFVPPDKVNVKAGNQCSIVDVLYQQEPPDMGIQKSGPTSTVRGSTIVFTLTANNEGQGTADSVWLRDYALQGFQFLPNASDPRCRFTPPPVQGLVDCNLGAMLPGQSTTITIAYAVPMSNPCTPMSVDSYATVVGIRAGISPEDHAVGLLGASPKSNIVTTLLECPKQLGQTSSSASTASTGGTYTQQLIVPPSPALPPPPISPPTNPPRTSPTPACRTQGEFCFWGVRSCCDGLECSGLTCTASPPPTPASPGTMVPNTACNGFVIEQPPPAGMVMPRAACENLSPCFEGGCKAEATGDPTVFSPMATCTCGPIRCTKENNGQVCLFPSGTPIGGPAQCASCSITPPPPPTSPQFPPPQFPTPTSPPPPPQFPPLQFPTPPPPSCRQEGAYCFWGVRPCCDGLECSGLTCTAGGAPGGATGGETSSPPPPVSAGECGDNADNDGDGLIDRDDPPCYMGDSGCTDCYQVFLDELEQNYQISRADISAGNLSEKASAYPVLMDSFTPENREYNPCETPSSPVASTFLGQLLSFFNPARQIALEAPGCLRRCSTTDDCRRNPAEPANMWECRQTDVGKFCFQRGVFRVVCPNAITRCQSEQSNDVRCQNTLYNVANTFEGNRQVCRNVERAASCCKLPAGDVPAACEQKALRADQSCRGPGYTPFIYETPESPTPGVQCQLNTNCGVTYRIVYVTASAPMCKNEPFRKPDGGMANPPFLDRQRENASPWGSARVPGRRAFEAAFATLQECQAALQNNPSQCIKQGGDCSQKPCCRQANPPNTFPVAPLRCKDDRCLVNVTNAGDGGCVPGGGRCGNPGDGLVCNGLVCDDFEACLQDPPAQDLNPTSVINAARLFQVNLVEPQVPAADAGNQCWKRLKGTTQVQYMATYQLWLRQSVLPVYVTRCSGPFSTTPPCRTLRSAYQTEDTRVVNLYKKWSGKP